MNWFLTLVLGVIAIMATIRTANMAALSLVGLAAMFLFFGWYQISWGVIALSILVSFANLLIHRGSEV